MLWVLSFSTRSKIRPHFSAYLKSFHVFGLHIPQTSPASSWNTGLVFKLIGSTENKVMKLFHLTLDSLHCPARTPLFICRSWVVVFWAALPYSSCAKYLATSHVSSALPDNSLAGVLCSLLWERKPFSLIINFLLLFPPSFSVNETAALKDIGKNLI